MVFGGFWCFGWFFGGDVGEGINYWIFFFLILVFEGKDMWDLVCMVWMC